MFVSVKMQGCANADLPSDSPLGKMAKLRWKWSPIAFRVPRCWSPQSIEHDARCRALNSRQRSMNPAGRISMGRRPSQRNNDTAIDVARADTLWRHGYNPAKIQRWQTRVGPRRNQLVAHACARES
jgi:hypothetical protein